jgi:hypothetical protein
VLALRLLARAPQARLLLEVARVYEPELVAHPEPEARLAYANFAAVQRSLQEVRVLSKKMK